MKPKRIEKRYRSKRQYDRILIEEHYIDTVLITGMAPLDSNPNGRNKAIQSILSGKTLSRVKLLKKMGPNDRLVDRKPTKQYMAGKSMLHSPTVQTARDVKAIERARQAAPLNPMPKK